MALSRVGTQAPAKPDGRFKIALRDDVHQQYRMYAMAAGVLLKDVQATALRAFFQSRKERLHSKMQVAYVKPPRDISSATLVIDPRLAKSIAKIAETDGVSARQVLHTALMQYYETEISPTLLAGTPVSVPTV